MTKLKISCPWDYSENIVKRLISQFKTPDIDLSGVEFVNDDTYDVIVFFNSVSSEIKENTKSFIFPHEPTWSSHQRHIPENTIIFGFKSEIYNRNCVELLAHTFYGGRGPWVDTLDFWSYDNLIDKSFSKSKNISSSITKLNSNYHGESCTYPQRFMVGEMINELGFVDEYGGWTNSSPKKQDAVVDYRFNISIENEHIENWITEKFYDSILTETVPIYFGCKNIKEVYPEDGYILINDINNVNEVKEQLIYINENADEIYNQKLDGLKKIKKKYFEENNLLKRIIKLDYEF